LKTLGAVVTWPPHIKGDWSGPQHRAVAAAAFEFCDGLFNKAFIAFGRAMGSSERALDRALEEPRLHPTVKLRNEIDGLRKELEDITHRLTTAETQRDELRRLFDSDRVTSPGPAQPET
jgi:hypothetical protein